MRKNSIKNTRVNEEVYRVLCEVIRELKDPRVDPMCSVVSVQVSPDLKTAKAYISVLGSDEHLDETIAGLKSSAGFIRREIAHKLNLRNTPEFTFIPDQSIRYGVDMIHKINEVSENLHSEENGEENE
ncbi:MAG: 30S ribosome-binding factor RbfA [Lachnospiraceae bacterium]|nr:30S ribosome-binding factor RbfA [Lachnospiraceae bacterium]